MPWDTPVNEGGVAVSYVIDFTLASENYYWNIAESPVFGDVEFEATVDALSAIPFVTIHVATKRETTRSTDTTSYTA